MKYSRKKWEKVVIFVLIIFSFTFKIALGVLNPASVYCNQLGYEWTIEKTIEGEIGICKFPDGSTCEEWNFLKGKCGEKYNYCIQKGYQLKTLSNDSKCFSIFSTDCAVCVLNNGTEIEVSKLMNLNLKEGVCGDDKCVLGEDCSNCPQDCKCSQDQTCQQGKCKLPNYVCGNDICEPNENCTNCPADCGICQKTENTDIIYIIAFSTVVIIIALYIIMRRRKFKTKNQYEYYFNRET